MQSNIHLDKNESLRVERLKRADGHRYPSINNKLYVHYMHLRSLSATVLEKSGRPSRVVRGASPGVVPKHPRSSNQGEY